MKIEGSVQEIELFFKKFNLKEEKKMAIPNELPPHEFPLISVEKCQQPYKEAQQEVPKEEKK